MADKNNQLSSKIADYYSGKLREFGNTPAGVDWNGHDSQLLRFKQLTRILSLDSERPVSVADLGCGYGALYDYLSSLGVKFTYSGYDLSSDMCEAAQSRLSDQANVVIEQSGSVNKAVDYAIASGIFSVRTQINDQQWLQHIIATLDNLNKFSSKGFAFNCLTSYSDRDKMQPHLYYADPAMIFDLCKKNYSNNVALLHDYGLYEFTILVRKL